MRFDPPAVVLPTRVEALAKLQGLIEGRISPEQASDWASRWLHADKVKVDDRPVWETIKTLAGADTYGGDRRYLYGSEDFEQWAHDLETAPSGACCEVRRVGLPGSGYAVSILNGPQGLFRYYLLRQHSAGATDSAANGIWSCELESGLFDTADAAEIDARKAIASRIE